MEASVVAALITAIGSIVAAFVGAFFQKWSSNGEHKKKRSKIKFVLKAFLITTIIALIIAFQLFIFHRFNVFDVHQAIDIVSSSSDNYDNFNNLRISSYFDQNLWVPENIVSQCVQKNGSMSFTLSEANNVSNLLVLKNYKNFQIPKGTKYSFEAKLRLDSLKHDGSVLLMIDHWMQDKNDFERQAVCQIDSSGQAFCQYANTKPKWETLVSSKEETVDLKLWQAFRITVRHDMDFTFFLDGKQILFYHPASNDLLLNDLNKIRFKLKIGVAKWNSKSDDPVIGYFDWVKVDSTSF